jgi:sec-independent protein translocase protein TatA
MSALLALPEGGEWIVILVIVVLVFGANKLPELTRNAARAMNEFKKVTAKDAPDETSTEVSTADEPAKPKQDSPPA